VNQSTFRGSIKSAFKPIVFWFYVNIYVPLRDFWRSKFGTCHVTILLYHRISEENLDPCTVTPKQFIHQLSILKREFEVIDMTQFLSGLAEPRRRPAAVITFDDGYEDNYLAAQVLHDANIPCTFFISTGIVGTKKSFPMDVRLQRQLATLSWDQVNEMSSWGFHIANHSVSHCDMGQISVEESLEEVSKATGDIIQKLGEKGPERWFAYPFGRPRNIKSGVVERLHANGIDFCFSAYGGVNQPGFNPYNIRRQPVNYRMSDLTFQAVASGYRIRS